MFFLNQLSYKTLFSKSSIVMLFNYVFAQFFLKSSVVVWLSRDVCMTFGMLLLLNRNCTLNEKETKEEERGEETKREKRQRARKKEVGGYKANKINSDERREDTREKEGRERERT